MTLFTRTAADTAAASDTAAGLLSLWHTGDTWVDGSGGGTPVSAVRLNIRETSLRKGNRLAISPLDFGAVGDGVADDTGAFRALLASLHPETPIQLAGVIPRVVDLGPYCYRITDTIVCTQTVITWRGHGVGNPRNYSIPGYGTTFRWDGPAGRPMFKMVDTFGQSFERVFFQGNNSASQRPSDLIYSVGGGAIGTNMHLYLYKCRFGSLPWSNPATSGTACADNGVRYGGPNANNDRLFCNDVQFEDCTTGLNLANTQSVWGSIVNTTFTAATIGLDTSSQTTMVNTNFQGCGTDAKIRSTARVHAVGWGSENSGLIADMSTAGGGLTVLGGLWLLQTAAMQTSGKIISHSDMGPITVLKLDGVHINNAASLSPKPKLYARRVTSGGTAQFTVMNCPGVEALTDLDITGGAGGLQVLIESCGLRVQQTLLASQSPSVTPSRVPVALTDATTIVVDASLGNTFDVTLGGNRTLGNPSNVLDGQRLLFRIKQDATGGRTLAYDTKYRFGTDITGVTLSTAANKLDKIGVEYVLAADKFDVISVAKGY